MNLYKNNYGPDEEVLRERCEPMKEFMDLKPIEVIQEILKLYKCEEDCPNRCSEGIAAGEACSPFVDRGNTVGICVCGIGKEIIMDFICFDFTAHVNIIHNEEALVEKVCEAKENRDRMAACPGGVFVIGDFTALRFFLGHMTLLPKDDRFKIKTSFLEMLDNIGSDGE
ncbi:MAG: hypothetical protein WC178_03445 [Candidatus Paceibacterota bacterium]